MKVTHECCRAAATFLRATRLRASADAYRWRKRVARLVNEATS